VAGGRKSLELPEVTSGKMGLSKHFNLAMVLF